MCWNREAREQESKRKSEKKKAKKNLIQNKQLSVGGYSNEKRAYINVRRCI